MMTTAQSQECIPSLLQDTGQIANSEQLKAKIERAEATYEQGEFYEMLPGEDLTAFLNRVGYDI